MPRNREDDREDDRDYDDRPPPRKRDHDRDRGDDRDDDRDYEDRPLSRSDRIQEFAGKKVAAGILGILAGGLGIHKFILGFPTAGAIMLVTWLLSFGTGIFCIVPWLATAAISLIGFVEGIIYLTKSDKDFYQTYAVQKKSWF